MNIHEWLYFGVTEVEVESKDNYKAKFSEDLSVTILGDLYQLNWGCSKDYIFKECWFLTF